MDPKPALIGAGVALVLLALAILARGEGGRGLLGRIFAAAAPPAAVIAVALAVGKSVELWSPTFQGKLLSLGVIAGVVGIVASAGRAASLVGVIGVAALAFVLFQYGATAMHSTDWEGSVVLYVAAYAGAAALLQVGRAVAHSGDRTIEVCLATAMAALAASPVLGWTGSSSGAFMASGVSASAGLFGLMAFALPKLRGECRWVGAALSTSQSLLLVGLLAEGDLFASSRTWIVAMVGLAPLVCLLPGKGPKWAVARLVIVAALVGTAVGLEKAHVDAKPANPYADAYGG